MEETEQNNKINYLDITIHKKPTNVSISVFRKPTYTDTLIPCTSNHPIQQKYAAVRFLYNRLNSYHLQDKEHQQEKNIQSILYNNSFPIQIQNPLDNHSSHPKNLLQVQKPLDNHSSQPQNPLNKKKMVHFHIHRQGNYIHYKDLQTLRHKNSILDTQYLTETPNPQHSTARQIHSIRRLQVNMSRLRQSICRANRPGLLYQVQWTQTILPVQ